MSSKAVPDTTRQIYKLFYHDMIKYNTILCKIQIQYVHGSISTTEKNLDLILK